MDTIADFKPGVDTIVLSRGVFADIGPGSTLGDRFEVGEAAMASGTRVIYNYFTGELSYDRDGNGIGAEAFVFANLDAGLTLTQLDFTLIN